VIGTCSAVLLSAACHLQHHLHQHRRQRRLDHRVLQRDDNYSSATSNTLTLTLASNPSVLLGASSETVGAAVTYTRRSPAAGDTPTAPLSSSTARP